MTAGVIRVRVMGIEVRGPGLANWGACQTVLTGVEGYCAGPVVLEPPARLSMAERRRSISSVRLALAVGAGAVAGSGLDPASLPAVFASSGADGETISAILAALATPGREVSPTRFHNSVHNAASGYWGIAMESREAVTSLSGYDGSFAAGLLEAGVQAVAGGRPVLLVAYDLPYPEPLDGVRRIGGSFAVGMVLAPMSPGGGLAELSLRMTVGGAVTRCGDGELEALRGGNPAARCLPLLGLLAAGSRGEVCLEFGEGRLDVGVAAC